MRYESGIFENKRHWRHTPRTVLTCHIEEEKISVTMTTIWIQNKDSL